MTQGGTSASRKPNLHWIRPFQCRMWTWHNRLSEYVSAETCRDEIASFQQHGQKHPVLGRRSLGDPSATIELIYGARRLFVAQHLNVDLLVDIQDLSDQEALVEMDIENRLRRDLSPYERGISYKQWLKRGLFPSQLSIANATGQSPAQVCRVLRIAELPVGIISAFPTPMHIKEAWGTELAARCANHEHKTKILSVARSIARRPEKPSATRIYKTLINARDTQAATSSTLRDEVVRSADGRPLFRVSYRDKNVHIILEHGRLGGTTLKTLTEVLQARLESTDSDEPAHERRLVSVGTFRRPAIDANVT